MVRTGRCEGVREYMFQGDLRFHAGGFVWRLRMKLSNMSEGLIYLLREGPLELVG